MEATTQPFTYITTTQAKLINGFSSSSPSLTFFNSPNPSLFSFASLVLKSSTRKEPLVMRNLRAVNASGGESPLSETSDERWVLEPVGDGDFRHIGFKVAMPNAFEIHSSVVTVGRVPEKADLVIPVATVSGLHARIKKKEGCLLVTDLDSTNGTYIDDQRLRPGEVAIASPGSCITFGDTNLAMFRVSKLANVDSSTSAEESEVRSEPEVSNVGSETTS